jgi:3',5'-cyclic AMP phosphodiesterase CpdA
VRRFLLAQLSDLHVVARGRTVWDGFDTAASTRAAVATLAAFDPRPDLVLVSGDLTDDGALESYQNLAALLEPLADRLVVLPGNHDRVQTLRAALPEAWYPAAETDDYVVEGVPRLICLDTSRPPSDAGALDPSQLEWLDAALAESDAPTIIALHHPPFETGIAFMDAIGLDPKAAEALKLVVQGRPHVERVVCGHAHRLAVRHWAGTTVVLAPSIASTIALDLRIGAGGSWNLEPPALVLHEWREGGGLVTHLLHVGSFPAKPI